ncbi:chromate efflux transporter [Macrococcus hajekii]|uniref:Chromate efflux transporter n=1 Tax=Macrococcus hajekii TaxID=198482 RepID=A0A4R6BJ99_9STAP|nr:chromate efflux transporter [Macrococcus hajekii]TDM01690.1 chromate efflux transporter [Macrococcus hajekii]GGB06610.1 chromate transporter [Macrococcus hajekii]
MRQLVEIFLVALKLGLTSFGGPTAHLGYFREEYVGKRRWLSDKSYQDLVALCQFLPGPASSQVGIGIGLIRGGLFGGIAAFLGFTLPSVLFLILAVRFMPEDIDWIQGLKLVAVAVVLQAIIGMAKISLSSWQAVILSMTALSGCLLFSSSLTQIVIILFSGMMGILFFKSGSIVADESFKLPISKKTGMVSLSLLVLLLALPLMAKLNDYESLVVFEKFYRSGLLVFGGGHVVLPLLEQEFVPSFITADDFIAGYGLAQAVPGPLFTFASYIGAVMAGFRGGLFAMIAIFLPAFLLVSGCLPFWYQLREKQVMRRALAGINAGVIGILTAAWINPIITHTLVDIRDYFFFIVLFCALYYLKMAPWLVVLTGLMIGFVFYK